jgi:hypothetical protein
MGVPGRLAVVAVLAMAGACSSPDEPAVVPVVCASDAPMAIDVPAPTEAEIDDTVAATGLDRGAAAQRARMQGIAMSVQSEVSAADPGYLGLRIDDEGDGLMYLTTEPEVACDRLEAVMGGAANGIEVVEAARSQAEELELLEAVQAELAGAPDGLVQTVRVDAETQLVLVQVRIDGGDEVEDMLEGLPDDLEELVVVIETDRVVSEGL